MAKHLSLRLAWHSDGWNGHVCTNPKNNTYCIGQQSYPGAHIAENRDINWESQKEISGCSCAKITDKIVPCSNSINAFGLEQIKNVSTPPEFFYDDSEPYFFDMPPATACTWPYEEMYKDKDYDYNKKLANAKTFFEGLTNDKSLVFYYANKSNPFSEDDNKVYVLVGVARLKKVGEIIAHYMKTLRATYNLAVNEGLAHEELSPFKKYKIRREETVKRAIVKGSISELKNLDLSDNPEQEKARDFFLFSFYCRGMSFVDLAYLKVNQIVGDRLFYARQKTHQQITIKVTPAMLDIIRRYNSMADPESYVFPIITDPKGDVYKQYRSQLAFVNRMLKKVGKMLKLEIPLTTYISRHSWATIAKRQGIPTAVISEGLGHETERTTQIYLDSFENQVLDDANDLITDI